MDIPPEPERPPALNEVFRRVGRNLLLLQQIELLLKTLLSASGFAGYVSEIPAKAAQRAEEISRKTLGQLAQQYHDALLGQGDAAPSAPENPHEPWFSMRIRFQFDETAVDRDRAVLTALVTERNELAHTFLSRWDLSSPADLEAAHKELDEQRARALPVLEHVKALLEQVQQHRQEMSESILRGDLRRDLDLAFLQASRIVQLLGEITATAARPDGWTDLAQAGKLLADLELEELANAKRRFGSGSLKRLLVASELFEVVDEPDGGGHSRTIYRKKAARPN
jgi:hypothetical protein